MKEKIDVIILTNNEEDVVGKAIDSVKDIAENIFIIDAGSDDNTGKIVKKKGAIFIYSKFKNFSAQRNFAILKAQSHWVFFLDADEIATDNFKKELLEKISQPDVNGFVVRRKTYYYEKDWGLEDRVPRVFRTKKFINWTGDVHETPHFKGNSGEIISPILHFTHRNLSQMINKTNKWSDYEARLRFEANHPKMRWWRFLRVMLTEFLKSYIYQKGYRNGTYGFIEAIYQSYSIFITYSKLWEMQKDAKVF